LRSPAFVLLSLPGGIKEYTVLRGATQDYIDSESAAQQLRAGSDYLTKQARLAAATGEQQYIDAYFEEANVASRREKALEVLPKEILDRQYRAADSFSEFSE